MIKTTAELLPGDIVDGQEVVSIEPMGKRTFVTFRGGAANLYVNSAAFLIDAKGDPLPALVIDQPQLMLTEGE